VTILAVLASGWLTLVLLAPWLPVPLAGIVYLFGGRLCHQIAERSFFLDGAQLPVCARCLGAYAGATVALICATGARRFRGPHRARLRGGVGVSPAAIPTGSRHTHVLLGALALNGLTVAVEWSDLWHVSTAMRAVAGAALGIAVVLAIRQALHSASNHEEHETSADTIDYERCPLPRRPRSALPESRT
jgi:uncharacterized membrane protein